MAQGRPRLKLLNRGAPADPAPPASSSPWTIWIIAATVLVLCALLVLPPSQSVPVLSAGQTATEEVLSPRDQWVIDRAATALLQQQASRQAVVVYDVLQGDITRMQQQLHATFADIRQQQLRRDRAALPEGWLAELLVQRLGPSLLLNADNQVVLADRFTRRLETALSSTLTTILTRGVLRERADGGPSSPTEALVRAGDSGRDRTVPLTQVADLATARQLMRQAAVNSYPDDTASRALMTTLGEHLLFTSLVENPTETARRQQQLLAGVAPVYHHLKRGDLIVAAGERVTAGQAQWLQALADPTNTRYTGRAFGAALLCLLIFYVFFLDLRSMGSRVLLEIPRALMTGLILVGTLALCRVMLFLLGAFSVGFESVSPLTLPYALPLSAGAMLVALLLNIRTALVFSVLASILVGLVVPEAPLYILYGFVTSLVGVFAVAHCQRRSGLIRAGLWVGLVSMAVVMGIDLQQEVLLQPDRLYDLLFAFCGGVLAAVVVSAVLPMMELWFNVPTNIRLLELSDLNHPLLRRLLERAPGTYHHSMIMSNMAEQAAEAIGENALLARVGCYYHDVGKMLKPAYFIENQWAGEPNRHDKLEPSMSRLILVAHVKEGIELARSYRLPEVIIDMIPQHHGTRLIRYFFSKAQQSTTPEVTPPTEENYRYPGPKPQTKVAGIIMLADTVEASSRVLEDPSPARLATLVDTMVNTIYLDQQLDECELTLKDLRRIADSFVKTLSGTFHHRIQYPGQSIPPSHAGPADQPPTAVSG